MQVYNVGNQSHANLTVYILTSDSYGLVDIIAGISCNDCSITSSCTAASASKPVPLYVIPMQFPDQH